MCTHLLDLPDLVLHHICGMLTNPFDLQNFGSTCTRLYHVSSAQSLWWNLAVHWLRGLWFFLEDIPFHKHPRKWFLSVLQSVKAPQTGTMVHCVFENGEAWVRAESDEFRCFLGLLQMAHVDRFKENHPGVLYERWLYDIGLYKRVDPVINFEEELSRDTVIQLSVLGQAKERDLRARKQRFKSAVYYVKVVGTSDNWITDLFPSGLNGSTCPLLICPFRDSWNMEASGISGLLMCLSWMAETKVVSHHKSDMLPLSEIARTVKSIVQSFRSFLLENLEVMKSMWGPYCLNVAVKNLAMENDIDMSPWQKDIDMLSIPVDCKHLMQRLQRSLEKHGGIDATVDFIRCEKRKSLMHEVEQMMFPNHQEGEAQNVTRINLTDSDFIGGDNSRQEMSAAAFVSPSSVLVTWHLIGRLRF